MINWGDDDDKKKFGRRWGDDGSKKAESASDENVGAKIDELIARAEPMVEQVNNLYTQFVAGVERLPPLERRKQLEQILAQLQTIHKPNATYSFKVNTLHTRFITMRDRWDKLIKDLESGKIVRRGKK
jgi:thiamine kinase-like enzyme